MQGRELHPSLAANLCPPGRIQSSSSGKPGRVIESLLYSLRHCDVPSTTLVLSHPTVASVLMSSVSSQSLTPTWLTLNSQGQTLAPVTSVVPRPSLYSTYPRYLIKESEWKDPWWWSEWWRVSQELEPKNQRWSWLSLRCLSFLRIKPRMDPMYVWFLEMVKLVSQVSGKRQSILHKVLR